MPYDRYPGNNHNSRRPGNGGNQGYNNSNGVSPWGGGMNRSGLLPTPGGGGGGNNSNLDQLAFAGNLLGSLLNGGNAPMANIANQLSLAQALQKPSPLMGPVVGDLRGPSPGNRSMMRRQRRDSPVRNRNSFRRRSRSRSPRNQRRLSDRPSSTTARRNHKNNSNEEDYRPEHEIYIGNYPLKFREHDVRKLFSQHNVIVKTIRMKHDGQKVFAFAETTSKSEIQKAIAAMDSKEINGRRLRVRAAGDKDPPKKDKPKKELTTAHVRRHLVFAFIEFLDRELDVDEMPEERIETIKNIQEKLRSAFTIEEGDNSLKVSRNLELIFMQNNRREINVPEDESEENKEASAPPAKDSEEKSGSSEGGESQAKKRKVDEGENMGDATEKAEDEQEVAEEDMEEEDEDSNMVINDEYEEEEEAEEDNQDEKAEEFVEDCENEIVGEGEESEEVATAEVEEDNGEDPLNDEDNSKKSITDPDYEEKEEATAKSEEDGVVNSKPPPTPRATRGRGGKTRRGKK